MSTQKYLIGQDALNQIIAQTVQNPPNGQINYILDGPPGIGKTEFFKQLAGATMSTLIKAEGPEIKSPRQINQMIEAIEQTPGQVVLAVDEVHAIAGKQEVLLPLLDLNYENLITVMATTEPEKISQAIKSRAIGLKPEDYSREDMKEIVKDTYNHTSITFTEDALEELTRTARDNPRDVLKKAQFHKSMNPTNSPITADMIKNGNKALNIDERGLDSDQRTTLKVLANSAGRTAGKSQLTAYLYCHTKIYEQEIEPPLVKKGLIERTSKGRRITPLGYQHYLKTQQPSSEGSNNIPLENLDLFIQIGDQRPLNISHGG